MTQLSDVSRRHLISASASALALVPSLARADLARPAAPTLQSADGAPDKHNRLTLETHIGGKGPFRFVVDTGADRSVIASDVAAALGLLPDENVVVQGIVRALPAPTVELKNLAFGEISTESVTAPVLPRKWLGADGFLGLDVIDGRRVTFDFLNRRLTVERSGNSSGWQHFNEVVIRADGSKGRLKAVDCTVQNMSAVAFVDSGAQISICNTALFAQLEKAGAFYVKDTVIPLMGATGGEMLGRLTLVSEIKLGRLVFPNSVLAVADLNVFNLWGLADKPALFLGMDLLNAMSSFTIDYRHKELRFKLADYITRDESDGRLALL